MTPGFPLALPLGGASGAPALPVTPAGAIFHRPDGAPWRYRAVSAFRLCRRFADGEDIQPFLDAYRGWNALRVWDYVGPGWGADAWDACTPAQWLAFIQHANARGFLVELTLLTDDDPARIEPARRLVRALGQVPTLALVLEAGNEPTTHKLIDTHALRGTLESAVFPHSSGDYEDSTRWYGTYYTCHTARTHDWVRRAHDLLEFFTGAGPDQPTHPHPVPCLGDEPGKLQDVGAIPTEWRAYFGACALLGGGACFHAETGKHARVPTDAERRVAAEALVGLLAFPADAPLGPYRRIVEPGQPEHARTYVVGDCAVRCQQIGVEFPEPGWTPLDADGILWTR